MVVVLFEIARIIARSKADPALLVLAVPGSGIHRIAVRPVGPVPGPPGLDG